VTPLERGARADVYRDLLSQVSALRSSMREVEAKTLPRVGAIRPENAESARSLSHHPALRRSDVRSLQEKLASVGPPRSGGPRPASSRPSTGCWESSRT